jgi:hypothetical protein
MEKKNTTPLKKNQLAQTEKNDSRSSSVCCGGAPRNSAQACCQLNEVKKAEGEEGCLCNTPDTNGKKSSCC